MNHHFLFMLRFSNERSALGDLRGAAVGHATSATERRSARRPVEKFRRKFPSVRRGMVATGVPPVGPAACLVRFD